MHERVNNLASIASRSCSYGLHCAAKSASLASCEHEHL